MNYSIRSTQISVPEVEDRGRAGCRGGGERWIKGGRKEGGKKAGPGRGQMSV